MRRSVARVVEPEVLKVDAAAHDGRGIAHVDGKVVFVHGALPGETVEARRVRRKSGFDEADTLRVLQASAERVLPECTHFGVCGGCAMQHASPGLQRDIKRQALADNLQRIGRVTPRRWLDPVIGPVWHYRRRARLSVRYVEKKGRVLVGFREKGKSYVADLQRCPILAGAVGDLLAPLARLIGELDGVRDIAQIEVAVADNATALVLRHLSPLSGPDLAALRRFGIEHSVEFYLQPGGYDTIHPLDDSSSTLRYGLSAHNVDIRFEPSDFVQVNGEVNKAMVERALQLLQPSIGESYLDLFCGLGNFTLPLARLAGAVIGVEGDEGLVARARENASRNSITNARFECGNLFDPQPDREWMNQRFHGVLLDPPRAGAKEILPQVAVWKPERIVYVSCHPGTLARDAGELVERYGYRLGAAGIIDMFPHTAHVESMALFER